MGLQVDFLYEGKDVTFHSDPHPANKSLPFERKANTRHLSYDLPSNFIVKSAEKIFSGFSNSSHAENNLKMLQTIPRGCAPYGIFHKNISSGKAISIEVPIRALRVIDDLSSGLHRTLIPILMVKSVMPSNNLRHAPPFFSTPKMGWDKAFKTLDAYRISYPKAVAVGFTSHPEADYLIIAHTKQDYLFMRANLPKPIPSINWFIANDVLHLLHDIFLHVSIKSDPPIPTFLSYEAGQLIEIPRHLEQDSNLPTMG